MSDYNQQAPRPKTILNHRSLSMFAPNGEGKFASLGFDFKKNDPIITVRTNIPGDANNDFGRIQAQIPLDYFYTVLEMLVYAANATEPFRWAYEHKDKKFIGQGKMTDGPVLIYRLIVGREESGVVFLSIVQEKRPNIKFSFLNNTKTTFKDNDGNEMPKAIESKLLTLGKVASLRDLMPIILKDNYKHPEQKPQNGGGGNYNRGGGQGGGSYSGGNGGGNDSSNMKSDDIPW